MTRCVTCQRRVEPSEVVLLPTMFFTGNISYVDLPNCLKCIGEKRGRRYKQGDYGIKIA